MTDNAYEEEGKYYDAIDITQTPDEIKRDGLQLGEFVFKNTGELDAWLKERGGSYEGFKKAHDEKIASALEKHGASGKPSNQGKKG